MVNLTNLLPRICDRDNSTKKKCNKQRSHELSNQMVNDELFFKKSIFNKGLSCWKATTKKNNKVNYSNIKEFKTQTM